MRGARAVLLSIVVAGCRVGPQEGIAPPAPMLDAAAPGEVQDAPGVDRPADRSAPGRDAALPDRALDRPDVGIADRPLVPDVSRDLAADLLPPAVDTAIAPDRPAPADVTPPADRADQMDAGPDRAAGVSTLLLDFSQITTVVAGKSVTGDLIISHYGYTAFPIDPGMPERKLKQLSASTVVTIAASDTCFASPAEVVKKLAATTITSLGAATVLEVRLSMPHKIPQDDHEHIPGLFCIGYRRRGGGWTWQPTPLDSLYQPELGRSFGQATLGTPGVGAADVDAIAVLSETGAALRTVEVDVRK
jgi:hypothetical protein